jgi:hypothetical protein
MMQPLVSTESNIINAANQGNYGGLITAAGPQIGAMSTQLQQARSQIMNTLPPGAARDYAISQLPVQAQIAQANILGGAFNQAEQTLAQLGTGQQGFGLQSAGAGLTASGQQQTAQTNIMNAQAQSKATTMGFLGALAGAGGAMGAAKLG